MLNPSRSHMVEMPQVVSIIANVDLEHEARYIHCGSHSVNALEGPIGYPVIARTMQTLLNI